MSARKTWERIAARQYRNMAFADFARVLEAFGFVLRRTSGSHRIYSHAAVPRPLSVQPVKGEAKPYQVRQFLAMVEEFDLEMEKPG
jgi:predicted RNA binding protein YcfA (HicA-like mRNA interferase family)